MRFLGTIIKRELVDNLTSSRYILVSVLCIILCLTSIILMTHDYNERLNQLKSIPDYTITISPPEPLSVIARGTDEVAGRAFQPSGHGRYQVIGLIFDRYGEEHHLFALFIPPDFVYIIGIILSALATFLSFDAISGEKESHTLHLVMSNPLPRATLLLGKWLGGYISFLICLIPALLLILVYLSAFSGINLQIEHWVRLLAIIMLSFVYLSVFYTLGLLVSTLVHRSASSLVIVLFIWTIWVLGIPRLGLLVAQTIAPTMTEGEHRRAKEMIATHHDITSEEREMLWNMDDDYIASIDKQIVTGQYLARVSPLASYIYASTTLAQTGIADYRDYRQSVKQWVRDNTRLGTRSDKWTKFIHRKFNFEQSLTEIGFDIFWLLLWNVCLFMGANLAFLRYDAR